MINETNNEKDKVPIFGNIRKLEKSIKEVKVPERKTSRRGKINPINIIPPNAIQIPVYKKCKILINPDIGISTDTILQLERILEIDKEYPDAIYGFEPSLYKEFFDVNNKITTHVKVGDTVKVKRKWFNDNKPPRKVTSLKFSNLHDMTIIIATLEDGDFYMSYQLEKYIDANKPKKVS